MIFFSESGLVEPSRRPEWDEWNKDHLAAMTAVPGVSSAQRFAALDTGVPPSLAMYTVISPAVFEGEIYLRTRGMGPWVGLVDETQHRRNLFEGTEAAPEIPENGVLAVADRPQLEPLAGFTWLSVVGLDRTTPYRGIAVFPDAATARRATAGQAALYRPMTGRYSGNPVSRRNNFGQEIGWPVSHREPAARPPPTPLEGRLRVFGPL